MFCTKCGKEISDDAQFCGHCGSKTGGVSLAPVQQQQNSMAGVSGGNSPLYCITHL